MREQTAIRLKITSTALTPQDIEARLGIKPDESWKIGDRTGTFGAVLKEHGYALDSTAPYSATLADHMRALIKRIAPIAQKIGEISTSGKVEMSCTIHCKAVPPMAFERDDIRWLAALGARLDFDIYVITERPSPQEAKKPGTASGS